MNKKRSNNGYSLDSLVYLHRGQLTIRPQQAQIWLGTNMASIMDQKSRWA